MSWSALGEVGADGCLRAGSTGWGAPGRTDARHARAGGLKSSLLRPSSGLRAVRDRRGSSPTTAAGRRGEHVSGLVLTFVVVTAFLGDCGAAGQAMARRESAL